MGKNHLQCCLNKTSVRLLGAPILPVLELQTLLYNDLYMANLVDRFCNYYSIVYLSKFCRSRQQDHVVCMFDGLKKRISKILEYHPVSLIDAVSNVPIHFSVWALKTE